ncbi:DUF550 domain-containing protein [Salmonella enterica subsp. enterica serovar Napoli]|nr:DUF550 domain-containing protein [Salmonella enterica subsp. enterica serovar Napoli]EHG1418997.1 DUF550 domain-containing protein [Salmonella enterica subsp. enterica serovar Napoli]EHG1432255.1 DUF550 domain-containing protein [Salmonella enterica subsp. enterica serovar Napoli]
MTTITKEWLQQTIAEFENTRDDIPFGLNDDDAKVLIVLKRALASLERERIRREHAEWSDKTFGDVGPVGPLKHLSKEALEAAADPSDPLEWADMQFLLWDAQRRMGISDEFITRAMVEKLAINKGRQWPEPKDGEPRLHIKEQSVPVVPDEITSTSAPEVFEIAAEAERIGLRGSYASYAVGWNACRAALLQGAEPVSQTYELPQTQFGQIADLYEMQFDDGRTCAFHTDDAKAAQWLLACDGNKVQEYVRIECYQEAVIGNPPVTQDGWISCSERIPDSKTGVLVACEFDRKGDWRMKWGTYIPGHPDARYGWVIPGASWKPSHWMPLPEPPQEVNRG